MPKPTFFNLPPDKRARIVDAAIEEFAAVPYPRATLDRIVEAAGVSKGSMYQYFDGKADLYAWLLTGYAAEKKLAAIAAGAPRGDVWAVLEHALLSGVRFAAAEPGLSRIGARFLRDHALDPDLTAIAAQNKAAGEAWLRQLLDTAGDALRPDLNRDVAVAFLAHALGEGMLDVLARRLGLTLDALLDRPDATARLSDEDLLALARTVTDLFRHGAEAR